MIEFAIILVFFSARSNPPLRSVVSVSISLNVGFLGSFFIGAPRKTTLFGVIRGGLSLKGMPFHCWSFCCSLSVLPTFFPPFFPFVPCTTGKVGAGGSKSKRRDPSYDYQLMMAGCHLFSLSAVWNYIGFMARWRTKGTKMHSGALHIGVKGTTKKRRNKEKKNSPIIGHLFSEEKESTMERSRDLKTLSAMLDKENKTKGKNHNN